MATRYRNAFFGFSGFVTSAASAQKSAPAKVQAVTSARASSASKKVPASAARQGARSKAA